MTDVDTQAYFDVEADDYYERNYEHPRNRHAHNLSLRRTACLDMLPAIDGTILDLGCGPGAMTFPLLERGAKVISMDLSSEMLERLGSRARRVGTHSSRVLANALALPFRDAAFSTVVTTGVLEYVPDLRAALREIHRVLHPNGTVVATMSLPRRLERFTMAMLGRLRGLPHQASQRIYDRDGFDHAIRESGFTIEDRRCCAFAPFPLDAIWPDSVRWIDQRLGDVLDRSDLARDQAKTYIVRASRS